MNQSGNYTIKISFFGIKFHYHGERREIDTYSSKENVPLSFSIKENEMVAAAINVGDLTQI